MEFTAQQIAQFVQGRVEGDENATVNTFAKIEEGKEGAISFLSNPKYTHYVYETKSSIVLIDETVELEHPVSTTLIRVKNAYECVAKLLQMYESMKPKKTGIDPLAFVSPKAKVAEGVYVGAFAYISDGAEVGEGSQIYPHAYIGEGVKIGKNALIYPNVTVYHGCKLGNNVTLHAGCVIGADGFGFAPGPEGYDKIPQIGIVTIEDDVEIGANTCVDRSTMGSTYVRKGVKLDNLVQIAHNTDIGANTVMSSQVGVAGSTKEANGVCLAVRWVLPATSLSATRCSSVPRAVFLAASRAASSSSELLLWSSALTSSHRPSSVACPICTRNSTT